MFSIRVTNYWGDHDDLQDLIILGPYPDAAARDAELARLTALPGVDGNATFEPADMDPATANYRATADQLANVEDLVDFLEVLYGLPDPDPAGALLSGAACHRARPGGLRPESPPARTAMSGPTGSLPAPEPGALRALRADVARAERIRVLDLLRTHTGQGRGSYRLAAELLEAHLPGLHYNSDDGPGMLRASVSGPCDSVELYEFDEDDTDGVPDPLPARIVVVDGADDSVAGAFLGLDDAEQVFREGLALVEKIRAQRTARTGNGMRRPAGTPVTLTYDEGTAVFNLLDAYLRTESADEGIPHLRTARAKLNRLWTFADAEALGEHDAIERDKAGQVTR